MFRISAGRVANAVRMAKGVTIQPFSRNSTIGFNRLYSNPMFLVSSQRVFSSLPGAHDFQLNEKKDKEIEPHFRRSLARRISTKDLTADNTKTKATINDVANNDATNNDAINKINKENVNATANPKLVCPTYDYDSSKYMLPMVNHVWDRSEIESRMQNAKEAEHVPKTLGDKFLHFLVKKVMYRGFNKITGFDYEDPTPKACAYRLIILESIAGVPGMVAAVMRHFTSLRTLRRDHGWIHTLLEEAQNERMHLLVCLKMFDAGLFTRIAVTGAQYALVTVLVGTYLVNPKFLHRFVGYLEETAVSTYSDLVRCTKTEGTKLNKAWKNVPASDLAKQYWNLPDDAMWLDVLEQLLADESHHRDVNHVFAEIDAEEPNPFVVKHLKDLEKLYQRKEKLGWKSKGTSI